MKIHHDMGLGVWQWHHTTSTTLDILYVCIHSHSYSCLGLMDKIEWLWCELIHCFLEVNRVGTKVQSGYTTAMTWALRYGNITIPLQSPLICYIIAYGGTVTLAWGWWMRLGIIWAHPLLIGGAHTWYRSIVDIGPLWHGHWSVAMATYYHFNHPRYTVYFCTQKAQ